METKVGPKPGAGNPNAEKTGSSRAGNRKTMTMMNRQYASLQSDASTDNGSDSNNLSRSCSSHTLGAMKLSSSVKDFKAREIPRVTPPLHQEEENEMPEVTDRSRSRTSAGSEGAVSQQQQQQQQLSMDVSTAKGSENRTPKSNEKDDAVVSVLDHQPSPVNASVKTRKEGFVKNFPDIAANDDLLEYYYCAYSRDILFPGFMYVTQEWICFHSKIMGKKDIRISVQSIVSITKARTAKLIPNAICIATQQERHVFASLVSRDRTYSLLMKIWKPQPKPEDDDSLNGSSQNGERNYVIDDISISSDDVTPSGSDDSPTGENRGFSENLTPRTTSERPEVGDRRQTVANGDVRDQSGRNLESSPMSSPRDRHPLQKDFSAPSASTTAIVLSITAFLTLVLILSAGMLALRLIKLQAQVEATLLPLSSSSSSSSHHKTFFSEHGIHDDVLSEDVYQLKHEHHVTTIQRLHSLLEVHLRLLDKVNQSLKSLQLSSSSSASSSGCLDLSSAADEYTQDANS